MDLHTLRYQDQALETNRQYILQHPDLSATVVDPGSADEALAFLAAKECNLAAILLTHHHGDHVAGVEQLLAEFPDCPVIVGDGVQRFVPSVTHILADGQDITVSDTVFRAMHTPGHTLTHYAFYTNNSVLFAGDCLFRLGCGRMFEGTPDMLWTSLLRLRALPDNTMVCCGHDYSVDNARFSLQLLPDDQALNKAVSELIETPANSRLPFLLGDDKASNLFLRADQPEVMAAVNVQNARDSLAALRRMRDHL